MKKQMEADQEQAGVAWGQVEDAEEEEEEDLDDVSRVC